MATRTAMIATTISSSARVKPFLLFLFIFRFSFPGFDDSPVPDAGEGSLLYFKRRRDGDETEYNSGDESVTGLASGTILRLASGKILRLASLAQNDMGGGAARSE